jgi:S1-C subfamily serine protease
MRRFFATLLLALLPVACGMTMPAAADWSVEAMNRTIDNANVMVNRGCSGTLIDRESLIILTAHHCVDDQYETIEREKISDEGVVTKEKVRIRRDGTITQIFFDGSESVRTVIYKVKLLASDKDKDLALVQVRAKTMQSAEAATIACTEPRRGEPIYVVGNPKGRLYSSVTKGIVSSLQRDYGLLPFDNANPAQPLMQVSAGVIGGNSGGAVYNAGGELVGVPVLANTTNEILGFAVPLPVIKQFLTDNKLERLFARCQPTP